MEAVRKPKVSKERVRALEIDLPPLSLMEGTVDEVCSALESLLPNTPIEELGTAYSESETLRVDSLDVNVDERALSPEPEELEIPLEEQSSSPEAFSEPDTALEAVDFVYPVLEKVDLDEASEEGSGLLVHEEIAPTAPMYPSLGQIASEDLGLMSDQELLMHYHNPLYERTDELVNRFCEEELNPTGSLTELLRRFRDVCDCIAQTGVEEKANSSSLKECLPALWTTQTRTHSFNGACGEFNRGTVTTTTEIAVMHEEKLEEMRKLLETNRDISLKKILCNEVEARSLELQINWIVNGVITAFLSETSTSHNSLPTLISTDPGSSFSCPSRLSLRSTLCEVFAFLRQPHLQKRCADAAKGWATELASALHKSCEVTDGMWILCHALRMPSPSTQWTAPLIQTFIDSSSSDRLKMDYCIAMISLLMSPVKSREAFLSSFEDLSHDDSNAGFTIVDEDGEREQHPEIISEGDLAALLEQLPIAYFYAIAMRHFTTTNSDQIGQFSSLVAFQLLLMKIFYVGMDTYSRMGYKAFCKQIGMALRKSVRELASHWRTGRAMLNPAAEFKLQKEMDRVVLLAVNYIVANKSLGLWQYAIDLPYDVISEECRHRVEYLMRKGGDDDCKSVRELLSMTQEAIASEMKTSSLAARLDTAGAQDTVFLVKALASLVAHSSADPAAFLREAVQVCLVDEATRDSLYKVGREAIAAVLASKPSALETLITIIDRSIDHIEEHVVDIFANSSLHLCKIRESVVGGVIGKWLIGRTPDTPANRVARKLLSSLNWGYDETGEQLWMSEQVHAVCADTVLKAHIAHCSRSSGFIASSVNAVVKLVYSMPDFDAHFSQFCWALLIKLKMPVQASSSEPKSDLAAYFLHAAQHSLSSPEQFADTGLFYMGELVNAGCYSAAAVLLTRAMALHYEKSEVITSLKNFSPIFERLIHADQYSYAYQLLIGTSNAFSGIGKLIACAIAYDSRLVTNPALYLRVWVDLLIVKRAAVFNTDPVSLRLLGTIARIAFERDAKEFLGIIGQLQTAHAQLLTVWEESSQGMLAMISYTTSPPPLIPPSYLSISPWASLVCLCAEDATFNVSHEVLYDELAQSDTVTLEEALLSAADKSFPALQVDQVSVFRWMELCKSCGDGKDRNSSVFVLALQKLAQQLFTPRLSHGRKHQVAGRFYASCKDKWLDFEKFLDNQQEGEVAGGIGAGIAKAVAGWIRNIPVISEPSFSHYGRLDLDCMLRSVMAENKEPWMDFIDTNSIAAQSSDDAKLYATVCHGHGRALPIASSDSTKYQRAPMRTRGSRALPFPSLHPHSELPQPPPLLDRSTVSHLNDAASLVQPLIHSISELSNKFINCLKYTEDKDCDYLELLSKLHTPVNIDESVMVKCSMICQIPAMRMIQVPSTRFNKLTEIASLFNREERTYTINNLQKAVIDSTALETARVEHIARQLCELAATSTEESYNNSVQNAGRSLIFYVISTVDAASSSFHLFPPVMSSLECAVRTLGKNFFEPCVEEQLKLMNLVMFGSRLFAPLADCFSPESLSPEQFVKEYEQLSEAAANNELSSRAFALLARFSISNIRSFTPELVRRIIPLAFINVTSVSASEDTATLEQKFINNYLDFTFYEFPVNFAYGLKLALKGCKMGSTPVVLLDEITDNLQQHFIDEMMSSECNEAITRALKRKDESMKWDEYRKALEATREVFTLRDLQRR